MNMNTGDLEMILHDVPAVAGARLFDDNGRATGVSGYLVPCLILWDSFPESAILSHLSALASYGEYARLTGNVASISLTGGTYMLHTFTKVHALATAVGMASERGFDTIYSCSHNVHLWIGDPNEDALTVAS